MQSMPLKFDLKLEFPNLKLVRLLHSVEVTVAELPLTNHYEKQTSPGLRF